MDCIEHAQYRWQIRRKHHDVLAILRLQPTCALDPIRLRVDLATMEKKETMISTGEREKRREEEECTYTYIHIHIPKKIVIYIPKSFQQTQKKLMEILKREGKSLSEWHRQNAFEYVRLHEPGNPQQVLPHYQNNSGPYHALKCDRCGDVAKYLIHALFASGKILNCCEDCFLWSKEHGLVRKVLRKIL